MGLSATLGTTSLCPSFWYGLRRLEYRGYDSAGLAVIDENNVLSLRRAEGKLHNLEEAVRLNPVDGWYGIGHTRWATHGRPTEENAHPHKDCHGDAVVIHNGIVENYLPLKHQLQQEGHVFVTDTDTEIIAHLVEKAFKGNLADACPCRLGANEGRFRPGCDFAARSGESGRCAQRPSDRSRVRRRRVFCGERYSRHSQPPRATFSFFKMAM